MSQTIIHDKQFGFPVTLESWHRHLKWMAQPGRTLFVMISEQEANEETLALLRSKAPTWDVQFVKFNYSPEWQSGGFKGGGGGGAQINWMLAMQMYFDMKFLEGYKFLMRFDDDIRVLSPSTMDVFQDMHDNGIQVGKCSVRSARW